MADPVSMTVAAVSMGATAAGGVTSAIGSAMSGQAQGNMYAYQQSVALMNKQIADQNESYALASGEVEAQQSGMRTRAEIGQTKATQGASNLDVNTGSNLRVREGEAEIGAENQALIRSNAARTAYGFAVEGAQDTAQGQVYGMAGANAIEAGQIGAFTSLLGGAAGVSDKWFQARQSGLFGSTAAPAGA
jgi:hypothetical protein